MEVLLLVAKQAVQKNYNSITKLNVGTLLQWATAFTRLALGFVGDEMLRLQKHDTVLSRRPLHTYAAAYTYVRGTYDDSRTYIHRTYLKCSTFYIHT
jgi:hypothetical protein